MFRLAVRNTIVGRGQSQQHLVALRHGQGRRLICNAPTPQQFQEAGFGKVLVVLTPLAAGAGVVTYAKHDDQFRKLLVESVPGIEPVLKVLLQEDGNALESATKTISQAGKTVSDFGTTVSGIGGKVSDVTSSVTGFFGGSPAVPEKASPSKAPQPTSTKPSPFKSAQPDDASPPLPTLSAPKPSSASSSAKSSLQTDAKSAVASSSAKVAAGATAATATKPTESKPSAPIQLTSAAPAVLPANIHELETAVEIAAQTAVNAYARAIDVLKSYKEDVQRIVDESTDKLDTNAWSQLKNKTSARDSAVLSSEKAAQVARATIDNLERALHSVAKDSPPEMVEKLGDRIRATSDHLNAAKDQMYNAKDAAQVSEKFWQNVEASRNYFIDEVAALFPDINLAEKRLQLSADDFNLFVAYAYSHVLAYQKEVAKYQVDGETRLRRAIEALRGDDNAEAVKGQLDYHLQKERQQLQLDQQKKLFAARAAAERELRLHMKRQAEAHADHLKDALQQREGELKRVFDRELNEKLWTEQTAYKEQLAAMLGKLKGMDAALKARGDADRMVHQSQALWSACQALWSSVRGGEPGVSWKHKLRPLASEVAAVGVSAEGDELVKVVLQGVPAEAKSRGVYPEEALRERFINVERLARRCAIVPAENATLPVYLLSFVQSMFVLTPSEVLTAAELRDEPIDVREFDTYDILNRAKYYMERGNLVQTLKYMNLLQGQPRRIAADWLKEARLLLETQQATNILMAHAATSGLSFL